MSKFEVGSIVKREEFLDSKVWRAFILKNPEGVYRVTKVGMDGRDLCLQLNGFVYDGDELPMIAENFSIVEVSQDQVNNPSHYASGAVECIDAIEASMTPEAFKGYLKGNIIKYTWRYEKKINPVQDLEKAQWYQKKLIETEKK